MYPNLRLAPCLLVPALLLAVLPCSPLARAKELPAKPNVILVFSDDQGFADLGCQGLRDDVKTPHLDRLARGGVRFTQGYVTAPQCVPSRAGLLTGRYQVRFGVETNLQGPLPPGEKTIAERLKKAGYVTGMFGKWHLHKVERRKPGARPARRFRLDDPSMPHHQGFDEYLCGPRILYFASHTPQGKPLAKAPAFLRDNRFRIDVQSEAAVSFIDRHAREPFFLYLPYFAPHVPLEAPAKYRDRFPAVKDEKRRTALAMIAAVDDGVGAIVKKLREHGIEKKTVIVFISDNGAPLRKAAWNGSLNGPLVGEKGMLTDGGIRVPFLMSWPGVLPAGKVYEAPVIALDVAATAVALAGLPADADLDGVNLVPYLLGEKKSDPHEALYWRWRSQAAVREGKWKLVLFGTDHRLLFDLESPEGEKQNVLAKHPEVADRLQKKLEKWATTLTPPGLPKETVPADRRFFDDHLRSR
jgi:arylsulfatase A-like enzyme